MSKNSKCFAPGCKSGYGSCKDKVSMFKAPANIDDRLKWDKHIPRADRTLSAKDVLCEKHFDRDDIIRCLIINDVTIPYQRPRLKKGVVPKHFSTGLTHTRKKTEVEIIVKQEDDDSEQEEEIVQFSKVFLVEDSHDVCFDNLFTLDDKLMLNEHWTVFPHENNHIKTVIFSQMGLNNGAPVAERQIVLTEHLTVKYFYGNFKLNGLTLPEHVQTRRELEETVNAFGAIKLCAGGPRIVDDAAQILSVTECAYIDYSRNCWRHKRCNVAANLLGTKQCKYCYSLYNRFKRNRNSALVRKKRVRTNGWGLRCVNSFVTKIKLEKYQLNRTKNRLERKNAMLKSDVMRLKEELKKFTDLC